ncbi:hypothetical protein D3870_09025 [Noviherbaspirillum cavernae]|uniref:Uncharacterized protein n=1 Tax=Noviherbaspirillum cavernae TaxID=2320862 RepID=A0A418X0U7_9BURK|nr:hypothetical protein [Noviherbaspirillum cavernae]RJG06127.1 hypothetical protein D3870_09025 [Noviherbaspirillum cavernae]
MEKRVGYAGRQPSLYAEGAGHASRDVVSILDALEPARIKGKKHKWLVGAAMLLLLAMSVAYLLITSPALRERASLVALQDSVFNRKEVVTVSSPSEPAPTAAAPVPEEPSVATIITEAASSDALQAQAVVPVDESVMQGAQMKSSGELDAKPAMEVSQAAASGSRTTPKEKGKTRGEGKSQAKQNGVARKNENKPAEKSAQRAAAASAAKVPTSKDRDVELIAALLAYSPRPGEVGKTANQKSAAAQPGAHADVDPATVKREKRGEPNSDVMVRASGESVEAQVKRCRAMGFFEGELCRMRVCSGIWGTDPACPSSSQTSSN